MNPSTPYRFNFAGAAIGVGAGVALVASSGPAVGISVGVFLALVFGFFWRRRR